MIYQDGEHAVAALTSALSMKFGTCLEEGDRVFFNAGQWDANQFHHAMEVAGWELQKHQDNDDDSIWIQCRVSGGYELNGWYLGVISYRDGVFSHGNF